VTKIPITVTVIHHAPVHVAPPDPKDHYPYSKRCPPDPAIYAPVIAYDCRLLDEGMGR
jgi:hypothetical protein